MARRGLFPLVLFFVIVPLLQVLVFLYLQTGGWQHYFVLTPTPGLVNLFLQNYTQLRLWQIFANLIPYLVVLSLIFIVRGKVRWFYRDMALIFLVLPFIISLAILAVYRYLLHASVLYTYGFSGIDAALLGYLVCLFVGYIDRSLRGTVPRYLFVYGIIGINFGAILLTYAKNPWGFLVLLVGVAFLFIKNSWVGPLFDRVKGGFGADSALILQHVLFCAFSVLAIFFYLPLMQIAVGGIGPADVTAHLSGYLFGLILGSTMLSTRGRNGTRG
ncbi:MAG: hypothetical protein KGH94_05325 [Candidatus Micrarchaeota archaeon]|nr:hypothetical protein [Candidatus Micrarchaeota archaeon]